MDGMLTMVITLKPNGDITFINEKTNDIAVTDVLGKKLWACPWFSNSEQEQNIIKDDCRQVAKGATIRRELEITVENGKLWIDFSLHPVVDEQGNIISLVAEGHDASKRKFAEEHVIRSQKMDALSQIVGGIAHDYNNMLGVITGYSGLLIARLSTASSSSPKSTQASQFSFANSYSS
jgi:nitrogen-specific signal transduction histidine kinase